MKYHSCSPTRFILVVSTFFSVIPVYLQYTTVVATFVFIIPSEEARMPYKVHDQACSPRHLGPARKSKCDTAHLLCNTFFSPPGYMLCGECSCWTEAVDRQQKNGESALPHNTICINNGTKHKLYELLLH